MAQTIAEAYVTIRPDLGEFRMQLNADVRSAVQGVTAQVHVGADTTQAVRSVDELKAKIDALRAQVATARVNVDDGDARARLDLLAVKLDEYARRTATADVSLRDVAEVDAELATVQAELDRIDGRTATAHVRVDGADTAARDAAAAGGATGGFSAALWGLGGAAAAAAAALAPAVGVIGALPGILAAAGAGVGAVVLGFSGIKTAMDALDKQEQTSSVSTGASARSAANAVTSASTQVRNAEESLAQTRRTTAQQEISADEAVTRSREQLGQTEQQVADERTRAAQQVADSEYALTQANLQAASAQQQLNDAREQAARDLEDSANRQVDAQLAAQQAALDLTAAEQNLSQVNASSSSTAQQREQASLDVAKAQQALTEANERAARSTEDNSKTQAAGVNGDAAVVAATRAVADAKHNQEQATRSLTDAVRAQQEQEVAGAQKIRDAEQAVTDAVRAQANTREQAAYQIQRAEQSVTDAQRSLAQAQQSLTSGSSAASTAATNAATAMAKLSPAGRSFVEFLQSLRPQLESLKATVQSNLLGGLQQGIEAMTQHAFPVFRQAVNDAASGIGTFFQQLGQLVGSPAFSHDLAGIFATNTDFMGRMGDALLHILDALKNVAVAAEPLTRWLGKAAEAWAKNLDAMSGVGRQSGALTQFFNATRQALQLIGQLIGTIASTIGTFIQAFAPVGRTILAFLNTTLRDVAPLITALGQALQPVIAALSDALVPILPGLVNVFTTLVNLLGPLLTAALHTLAPLLPVLVTALNQILTALQPLMPVLTQLITQVGTALVQALQTLIPNFVQLVQTIAPVLPPIVALLTQGLTPLLRILTPIIDLVQHLALAVLRDIVVPIIRDIVMPVLSGFVTGITNIGTAAKWLWHNAIEPAFDGIKAAISFAWNDVIRPTLKFIVDAFLNMAGAIIHAAADAFGWVPVIGGKLQSAAKHFDEFRDSVNNSLSGIHDKTISVEIKTAGQALGSSVSDLGRFLSGLGKTQGQPVQGHAAGGRITGPGGPREDRIPALVSNGEFIVNAEATKQWLPVLDAINTRRYASGGLVLTTPGVPAQAGESWSRFLSSIAGKVTVNVDLGAAGGAAPGGAPAAPGSVSGNVALGKAMAAPRGWATGSEWNSLYWLWNQESGWRITAGNPGAAYGIPQADPGSKMASAGPNWLTDAATQIKWGLDYILRGYGDPNRAVAHKHATDSTLGSTALYAQPGGWYDRGGVLPPGGVARNGTTRPELILSPEQTAALGRQSLDPQALRLLAEISRKLDALNRVGPDIAEVLNLIPGSARRIATARVAY